ncbi:CvpA family protein [Effusibacillus dendaii]|uniref:Putative transmembrane protein YshB n=1 Tax=Effusibacillus dendaii TaxID=2743772 RepID=A0A7I8DDJ6_9BACL|nr:CvpA family protein [Effusibacillus dendaii]BCJ88097.1 putative transmembrane protein YshB [Effusibacillus dendaii]
MTTADIILSLLLLLFVWNGYRTGLVQQIVGFVGVFAGYWVAKTYSPNVTPLLQQLGGNVLMSSSSVQKTVDSGMAPLIAPLMQNGYGVLAFILLFAVTVLVIRIVGRFLGIFVRLPGLSFLNRVSGLVVGLVIGVLVLVLVVNVGAFLPVDAVQTALQKSQIAHALQQAQISGILFGKVGK